MTDLIYDRTKADVDRAAYLIGKIQRGEMLTDAEKTEYFSGLKGCINASDLNRVETKVKELVEVLRGYGYTVGYVSPGHSEWAYDGTMKEPDVLLYLANIAALRRVIPLPEDIPPIPTIDEWIDWTAANDIERIVYELDRMIYGIVPLFRRCGAFRAGNNARHLLLAQGVS